MDYYIKQCPFLLVWFINKFEIAMPRYFYYWKLTKRTFRNDFISNGIKNLVKTYLFNIYFNIYNTYYNTSNTYLIYIYMYTGY